MSNRNGVIRVGIAIRGAVQGVGFRPFVYRVAVKHLVTGFVRNQLDGVYIEAQGKEDSIHQFLAEVRNNAPKLSQIETVTVDTLPIIENESYFSIDVSQGGGTYRTRILPDIAICPDCIRELNDPNDRRYQYPFINCTLCGPRYTIVYRVPYDRENTSMRTFVMCEECRQEYEDPTNRRFHAEPIACPRCGPQVQLWDSRGKVCSQREVAIEHAVKLIKEGHIIAVKGLGGFHLVVDATNVEAVAKLRLRKHREEKPFALMYPNIEELTKDCIVTDIEKELLFSLVSPIVLVQRSSTSRRIASEVAPQLDRLGVMLPYTPLHYILLTRLAIPVVATSGNVSDEPICIDEHEALYRLHGIADYFLIHNRPIVRAVDDSIVHVVLDKPVVLRRARGYVPHPITISMRSDKVFLAVGGHLKNTIAINQGNQVILSQHLGDLETYKAVEGFHRATQMLTQLVDSPPDYIVADAHPDYASTGWANGQNKPVITVQHHIAHALAVVAEKKVELPALAVSWDGTGYGMDGTIWGGEFFIIDTQSIRRIAHIRTFPLPGGDKAVREPRRSALGVLYEMYGPELISNERVSWIVSLFTSFELHALIKMIRSGTNTPKTSSIGRLFDAVAVILGLTPRCSYEAQVAMQLEALARKYDANQREINGVKLIERDDITIVDWQWMMEYLLEERQKNVSTSEQLAFEFHSFLAQCIYHIARREMSRTRTIILNGGCFQNRLLLELAYSLLKDDFNVYFAEQIPPNDGGISLGQLYYALHYSQVE